MPRRFSAMLLATLAAAACAHAPPARTTAEPQPDPNEALARQFIAELAAGQFGPAADSFSDEMKKALPPEKLAAFWQELEAQKGSFQGMDQVSFERAVDGSVELARCRFGNAAVTLEIAIDPRNQPQAQIDGLWKTPAELVARRLVNHLSTADYGGAEERFDAKMREMLPPARLAALWDRLQSEHGAFQTIEKVDLAPVGDYWAALLRAKFARQSMALKVVVDGEARIAGFFVQPVDWSALWHTPPYADPGRFSERAVVVGDSPALPGHLTLPAGKGPFPAVVLIQGSGPNDEDESIGPNKIFKDLAEGLATRGIAVLRYDKVTHVSHQAVATVREEYFESFKAALALLRRTPEIDSRRLVVLGHSEGAYLAPWMARDNPKLAGIVMLASPARPLLDVTIEQLKYFETLDPRDDWPKAELEKREAEKGLLAKADVRPDEPIFHATAAYFLALRDYQPVAVAARLKIPMLVLQGGRDYQVSPEHDFELFQAELAKRPNAMLRLYPELNHLFIEGKGKSQPSEYDIPSHVSGVVIDDIASWVLQLKRGRRG